MNRIRKQSSYFQTALAASFFGLVVGLGSVGLFFSSWYTQSITPEPLALEVRQFRTPYQRQVVSAADGGVVEVDDRLTVTFPANFTDQDVVASFRQIETPRLTASHQVGSMFELTARLESDQSQQVTQFDQALELNLFVPELLAEQVDTKKLGLYYFDTNLEKWVEVSSSYNSETNTLVASVDHFTVFTMAAGDPNANGAGAQGSSFIVDNQDPEPAYVPGGLSDATQPQFWGEVGSGVNDGAAYTGNSVDDTARNWATWSVFDGLTGDVEVTVTIPNLIGLPLTEGATYVVTHAGGQSEVTISQEEYRGGIASLGTFTFAGSGSVYLSDVVVEKNSNFASYIVFDAVSFGEDFGRTDFTPPVIEDVRALTDAGYLRVDAKVTDDESGVAEVYLVIDGQAYLMEAMGDDRYALDVQVGDNQDIDWSIVAYDVARNEGAWLPGYGYVTRSAYYSLTGYYPGMIRSSGSVCNTDTGCGQTTGQIVGHPVNTYNGNLIEELTLLEIGGRPEIALNLTYNNQSGRPSIFGENWTHSYNYHALEINTPGFEGVYIQYPDGKVAQFTGPDLTPESGYFETLTRSGDGFILTMKDLTTLEFDADGDLIRMADANGNGLNFSYGQKSPLTLLSRLETVIADGGRSFSLSYNDQGFVETITAPENKTLSFAYSDQNDLASWTDARGGTTKFAYDNHNMIESTTPEGYVYMTNQFDDQRRVIEHHVGEDYHLSFSYGDKTTTKTDSNGNQTVYTFNDEGMLLSETDAAGNTITYTHTVDKQLASVTDQTGATTSYEYDTKGNKISEEDALGQVTTWVYDQTFNKPLSMVDKTPAHITNWTYDAVGNLLSETNALGDTRELSYDSYGQLEASSDFRGNETSFSYSPEGDLITKTLPEGENYQFGYDTLGRLTSETSARGNVMNYGYDGNDNLVSEVGPEGFSKTYTYDKNDRLIAELDPNGGELRYDYNKSNKLVAEYNQLDFETRYEYGLMNELLASVSPKGRRIEYRYDDVYNVITITEAVGTPEERTTEYEYDPRHDLVATVDPLDRRSELSYDALGRQIKEVINVKTLTTGSDVNLKTEFSYDAHGNLLSQTDALNNETVYSYDLLHRQLSTTDAESQTSEYQYDADGNLILETNPRGFSTAHEYDRNGRLVLTTDARNGQTRYNYDRDSNLSALTDANSITTAYQYDGLNRRTASIANAISGTGSDAETNVTTSYSYDPASNLIAITNPRGYTTSFRYDAAHRQIGVVDAVGNQARTEYDQENNVLATFDRNNHSYSYSYDILNRTLAVTNPESHVQGYEYDIVDNLVTYTNQRGKVWSHQYDRVDRISQITNPLADTVSYQYDKMGNVLSLTDENNHTDSFAYDKVYRLISSTDAEGNLTAQSYDQNSNLVTLTDAEGNATTHEYDELDRLVKTINAENEVEEYAYDATKNMVERTEADQTPHQFEYDPLYRLAEVINNARTNQAASNDTNVRTSYDYDANGNLIANTNANGATTTMSYDPLDRLISETNPIGDQWQYGYDPEGNQISRLDANGVTTNYSYYPDDILQTIDYPEYDVSYTYSETNFPVSMSDALGQTRWSYDDLDRMTSQQDPLGRELGYAYDAVGNLQELTYPDGRSVSHSYLKNDWLQATNSSDGHSVEIDRNKVGQPVELARSNQTRAQISYDKVYRPLEVVDLQLPANGNKKPETIAAFSYDYDPVGHIAQEVAEYGWKQPSTVTTTYGYDGLHRLIAAQSDDDQHTKYVYDPVGNRVEQRESLQQGLEIKRFSYNPANQLLAVSVESPLAPRNVDHQYRYDGNGNRVVKQLIDETGLDRGTEYNYDTENRLTQTLNYQLQLVADDQDASSSATSSSEDGEEDKTTGKNKKANEFSDEVETATDSAELSPERVELDRTQLAYDGNGRRLVSTYFSGASDQGKRTEFTFDRLDPVAEYYIWNGQRQNLYRTTHAPLVAAGHQGTDLLAFQSFKSEQDPSGTEYFFHHDGKGNVAATSKHSGQADKTYRFNEYGSILPDNGSGDAHAGQQGGTLVNTGGASGNQPPHNAYTLSQKRFDPNMGTYYFGTREYDPEVGVWLTQDTYRGQIANPQSTHRYMYNYASPQNYVDWYGYCSKQENIDAGCPDWMWDWFFDGVETAIALHDPFVDEVGEDATPKDQTAKSVYVDLTIGFGDVKGLEEAVTGIDPITGEEVGVFGRMTGAVLLTELRHVDKIPAKHILRKTGDLLNDAARACSNVVRGTVGRNGDAAFDLIGSTGKIGENELKKLGGVSQKFFNTSSGARYVDQFVDGVAHESKVGYTSLTLNVRNQIAKDAELLADGEVKEVVWHFYRSPVTGQSGPSQPLLEELERNGFRVVIE